MNSHASMYMCRFYIQDVFESTKIYMAQETHAKTQSVLSAATSKSATVSNNNQTLIPQFDD